MKNCIIIHGCPSKTEKEMNPETRTYDKHWIPWTKNQLAGKGVPTETPAMPDPWEPDYEKYKQIFEKLDINDDTILVGHSCGCAFLVRWLGETKQKISKLALVAPWKIADVENIIKDRLYTFEIDELIRNRVGEIIMFTSNDEEEDGKKSLAIYHQALDGEVIELKDHGHYILGDMGTEEFPELINVILR